MNFDDILRQILSENGVPGVPADEALFEQVERRYCINLPTDVKQNYLIMNGSQSYTSGFGSWMRFWPLEDWRPAIQKFPSDSVAKSLSGQIFVCADYGIECVYFVIDLDELSPTEQLSSCAWRRSSGVGLCRAFIDRDLRDFALEVAPSAGPSCDRFPCLLRKRFGRKLGSC